MARAQTVPWERVSGVIAESLGLYFPRERWGDLERGLQAAALELGLEGAPACAARLLEGTPGRSQLQAIASHLTIGETYFFRDASLFDALRGSILPPLVAARRGRERRLRLWSAGCCTGEEPYSLAILLHELLPDVKDWNVTILATDVNPRFLQKAAAGVYGDWSFRGLTASFRARWFRPTAEGRHALRPEVKRLVTFAPLNLAQDLFPSITSDTNAMDVILCRNVLMYFTPDQMRRVVGQLRHALLPGGYLAVSPSEVSHAIDPGLTTVSVRGALLYRRGGSAPPRRAPVPMVEAAPPAARALPARPAARPVTAPPPPPPPRTDFAARARECANLGELEEALAWCDRWVAAEKLDAGAHYLRAMVLLELGRGSEATRALQHVLYLKPAHVMSHVTWGNLARTHGREREARRHFQNALALLEVLAPDAPVADSEGLTAGRLAETLAALASEERTR